MWWNSHKQFTMSCLQNLLMHTWTDNPKIKCIQCQMVAEAKNWEELLMSSTISQSSTSNVTGRHRGPKRQASGWLQNTITTTHLLSTQPALTLQMVYFASSNVVSCAFSEHAMRVFDIRASSSPLGYPCATFHFCRTSDCWACPWRKIGYTITHSLTQLIWHAAGNRSLSVRNIYLYTHIHQHLNILYKITHNKVVMSEQQCQSPKQKLSTI